MGKHIGLVWSYGKWIILAGGLYNVVCACFLAGELSGVALVLKWMYSAVVLYLHRLLADRDAIFFYINLGWSRKRLLTWTLGIDFGLFILMETVMALCQ